MLDIILRFMLLIRRRREIQDRANSWRKGQGEQLKKGTRVDCNWAKKCLRICTDADSYCACAISHTDICFHCTFYSVKWFCKRIAKSPIRLRVRAVWFWSSLSAYARNTFFAWRCLSETHRVQEIERFSSKTLTSIKPVSEQSLHHWPMI